MTGEAASTPLSIEHKLHTDTDTHSHCAGGWGWGGGGGGIEYPQPLQIPMHNVYIGYDRSLAFHLRFNSKQAWCWQKTGQRRAKTFFFSRLSPEEIVNRYKEKGVWTAYLTWTT